MFFERILLCVFCLGIEAFPRALAEEVEIRDVGADKGTNVTIPCGGLLTLPSPNVQWVHRGNKTHHEVLVDGSLLLKNIAVEDAGLYECSVENETAFIDRVNLTVRRPSGLKSMTRNELYVIMQRSNAANFDEKLQFMEQEILSKFNERHPTILTKAKQKTLI